MAGRKPKADTLRIAELTEKIEKAEKLMSVQEKRIQQYKEERAGLLAHLIVGQMEERHLNYPQVESLLTQLFKGEPSPRQSQKLERHGKDSPPEAQGQGIAELKVRVSAKEKKQIYKNMKKANYECFNNYARKLLLDGYLVVWTSPELRELKAELGSVNRSLNQLVHRANITGSIYTGDFLDILECWKKIQKETLHFIDQMIRKSA